MSDGVIDRGFVRLSPTLHLTSGLLVSVFGVAIVFACVFKIEVIARGQGRIVPLSRVQAVQTEFTGTITAINVTNGAHVAKGDVLVKFDKIEANAELAAIRSERDELTVELARIGAMLQVLKLPMLEAEVYPLPNRTQLHLPPEFENVAGVIEQRHLLQAEIAEYAASLRSIRAREKTNALSSAVVQANIGRIDELIAIQRERLDNAKRLLDTGTSSRSSFLDVLQAAVDLENSRKIYLKELDQKEGEKAALEIERQLLISGLHKSHFERRSQIAARLSALGEKQKVASRKLAASEVRAPVSGMIDQLKIFTLGGVAQSGEELLRVVPDDIGIEVEAIFPNSDIGFLKPGQHASIRLEAFPSERFGYLKGRVTGISADSRDSGGNQWIYTVRIAPLQTYLPYGSAVLPLRPGMTAQVDVTTDKRRLISYFFAPIVETLENALGER